MDEYVWMNKDTEIGRCRRYAPTANFENPAAPLNVDFRSAEWPIIQSDYIDRLIIGGQSSLDRVLDFLKAADLSGVEKIYLLHISKNNADPAEMKRAVQSLTGKQVVCSV